MQARETRREHVEREIVVTRVVQAPRELVWKAFTEPEHVAQWWGPNGFTNTISEMDVRPGGVWRFTMHGLDGVDYPNLITFREVVEPERLQYTHNGTGDQDHIHFEATVTLTEQGDRTEVTLRAVFESKAERDEAAQFGAIEGGEQTLGRLDAYLASMKK